jgi:hypothetical protein
MRDASHDEGKFRTFLKGFTKVGSIPRASGKNPNEYWIGTIANSRDPWTLSLEHAPSVDWEDLKAVMNAVPSSPTGRYIVMAWGRLYENDDEVRGFSVAKYVRDIHRLWDEYLSPGGDLNGLPFEVQVQQWTGMLRTPEKILGWAVKSIR